MSRRLRLPETSEDKEQSHVTPSQQNHRRLHDAASTSVNAVSSLRCVHGLRHISRARSSSQGPGSLEQQSSQSQISLHGLPLHSSPRLEPIAATVGISPRVADAARFAGETRCAAIRWRHVRIPRRAHALQDRFRMQENSAGVVATGDAREPHRLFGKSSS